MATTQISLDDLEEFLKQRNQEIKDKVASIYIKYIQKILMKCPFSYSESISSELSRDIVKYGDKLMRCCGCLDCDEDDELNEVNGKGFDFQTFQKSITLKVLVEDAYDKDVSSFINVDENYTSVSEVASLTDTLVAVRDFLKNKGSARIHSHHHHALWLH